MRSAEDVRLVFRYARQGLSKAEIAQRVGVARATVRDWLAHGEAVVLDRPMRRGKMRRGKRSAERCAGACQHLADSDPRAYAYLLGQYLGDGCISCVGTSVRLRITCCDAYPAVMAEVADAIRLVAPTVRVGRVARQGCTDVYATWPHWLCLLPHGEGVKHRRPIVLEPWQRAIALGDHPDGLIRGLLHSDGCRCINRVTVRGRTYQYPRYLFTNLSPDIRGLFLEACERLEIDARRSNAVTISVARRASVDRLDRIVGPKR